jgi:bifunctional DNase/RNase
MIEMKVKTIAADMEKHHPVMILTDAEEKRYLPIWIGGPEAYAILLELQGTPQPRPLTHDLLKNVIEGLRSRVKHIVVNDLQDSTYFARIILEIDGKEVEIDARPSDSIALALRCQAPIYVSEKVMQTASPNEEKLTEEKKRFQEFIKTISADQFANPDPLLEQPKPPAED